MINIILFGPPGSGKGTQSIKIAEKYGLVHISTGDIFRREIREKSDLGIKVRSFIEKGELVPDELLIDILKAAMVKHHDPKGFVFDGFPRTITQASDLDKLMEEMGLKITLVLVLDVNEDEIIGRLLKRAELEGRSDDNEDVIKNRLKVYRDETEPLIRFYEEKKLSEIVDGIGGIDNIFNNLCEVIDRY